MQELSVVYLHVRDLVPYAQNARTHSDEQVAQIAASIAEFGWTNPLLIDGDNGIIAGHGRLMAAARLGMEKVPAIRLGHLTDAQRRALILADNQIAANAGWDEAMLREEILALTEMQFDPNLLGFDEATLASLLATKTEGLTDEDAVPEVPEAPVSRAGDLWLMDDHRLICGSSTDSGTVAVLLGDDKPGLMVTDPPYGVNYDPSWRNEALASKTARTGKVLNDDRADWREAWALFPGDVAYVWHGAVHAPQVEASLVAAGFKVRAQIIWGKERLVLSRGDYHWQHEPCLYAVREKGKPNWNGSRKDTTLWDIATKNQDSETVHGTQKPVECMRRPMENNSSPGQFVYEPFMGSGTTLIAAETCGRMCLGVELNPAYVDVAVKRWQAFTGRAAVHSQTGKTFDAMAEARIEAAA